MKEEHEYNYAPLNVINGPLNLMRFIGRPAEEGHPHPARAEGHHHLGHAGHQEVRRLLRGAHGQDPGKDVPRLRRVRPRRRRLPDLEGKQDRLLPGNDGNTLWPIRLNRPPTIASRTLSHIE